VRTRSTPKVKDKMLTWYDEEARQYQLAVGTSDWYAWLEHASRFSFEGEESVFTARKEPGRHGNMYWKAYRKQAGKLQRAYLGKSEALTFELLTQAATRLSGKQVEGSPANSTHLHQQTVPFRLPSQWAPSTDHAFRQPAHRPSNDEQRQSTAPSAPSPSTLPLSLTALLGREQEVTEACRLLAQTEVRLLTLSGPGGVDKTRLAVEIGDGMQKDFAEGVRFISLASLQDSAFVLPTIAQALHLQGSGPFAPLEHLKAYLHTQHCLLIVDNFEHVIEAAPLLVDLLASCPSLKILVTSREILHIRGEHELPVMPLILPDAQALSPAEMIARYGAIALFVERAQEVMPSFQLTSENAPLVAEICQRLDGLPLAIELAAARLRLLSPQALLERLTHRLTLLTDGPRDVPARQQAMRSTLQWSYDLLSAEEQRLFRLLASFVGGCTLPALETVYSMLGGETSSLIEIVTSLLNKHLLYQCEQDNHERRLKMLETIREYGWELLQDYHEMEEIMNAQATYYVQLAEQTNDYLFGEQQKQWFDQLEWERDNLRAALRWFVEQGELEELESPSSHSIEMALRLAGAVGQFWTVRWYLSKERLWLERALARSEGVAPSIKAKALQAAAWLAYVQDDGKRAEERYRESLTLYRALGEPQGIASVLHWVGSLAWSMRNDARMARSLLEESSALAHSVHDNVILAIVHTALGNIAIDQGDFSGALACFEQSLAFSNAAGSKKYVARTLRGLGRARLGQGDLASACALVEQSLALCREVKDKLHTAYALDLLGCLTFAQGDAGTARGLFEEALVGFRTLGAQRHIAYVLSRCACMATVQLDEEVAHTLFAESMALFQQVDDCEGMACCLQGWGALLARQGNLRRAVRLWGAAQSLRDNERLYHFSLSVERADVEQMLSAQMVEEVRRQLGRRVFAATWVEGRTMTPAQVLASSNGHVTYSEEHADQRAGRHIVKQPAAHGLTGREIEVLRLVTQGCTDAQIAEALVISPRTVHAHLRTIYRKLDVSSRFAAIHYAREAQLI
jgi:predicted ATPase/DNA-binding CsgD family transcriptional regulator